MLERVLDSQFGGSGRIDLVLRNLASIDMKPQDSEKFIRRQGSDKKVAPGLAVVDQLAADGAMQAGGCVRQVVDNDARAVFTEAVGKHTVGSIARSEIHDRRSSGFEAANRLDQDRFCSRVPYGRRDGYEIRR